MWFTETPWPPLLICAALVAVAVAAFHTTRRNRYLVAIAVLIAAGAAIVMIERKIVTPSEEVELAIAQLCSAFQRDSMAAQGRGVLEKMLGNRDVETLDHISAHAADVRRLAIIGLRLVTIQPDFEISDVQVDMKADDSRAVAHCRVNGNVSYAGYGSVGWKPSRWLLTWQREDSVWKVIKVQRLDVITGHPMDNPVSP